jgi:hypothetical protein
MAKVSKASVEFEAPAKGPNHCGMCRHFQAPSACELVAGTVRRVDWCRLFRAFRRVRR